MCTWNEGQSEIIEPYLITYKLSKIYTYFDEIS